jgi:DNA repair photolyase
MNSGSEFDQRVFAKVNAPQVLREELRRPRWQGEPVAIGTASDPYEPAEAQYRLTRQIIQVLAEFRNPASITTKGVLARRDVDVLLDLYHAADVQVIFSVGSVDETVWKRTEPGTPNPMARLEAMQFLVESGVPAGVMMAPLLPGISDSSQDINATVQAAARHHAQFLSANLLFLKPGSREWFMPMLRESYPHLTTGYQRLYQSTYAGQEYTQAVLQIVDEARRRCRLSSVTPAKELNAPRQSQQLALIA